MSERGLRNAVTAADAAINREDFEQVMSFYAEVATLVLQPGSVACGKEQIRSTKELHGHVAQAVVGINDAAGFPHSG